MEKIWIEKPTIKIPRLIKEAHKKKYNIKPIFKKFINIGMIKNSKSIGIRLSRLFPEVLMWRKNPFFYVFAQVLYKR